MLLKIIHLFYSRMPMRKCVKSVAFNSGVFTNTRSWTLTVMSIAKVGSDKIQNAREILYACKCAQLKKKAMLLPTKLLMRAKSFNDNSLI